MSLPGTIRRDSEVGLVDNNRTKVWSTWVVVLVSLMVGMVLGWIAHGLVMHRMMRSGMMEMMGRGGMMDSMMARCQESMGEGGCPMMQAAGDTNRQSPGNLDDPVFSELDEETRQWIQSARGDITPRNARGKQTVTVNVGDGNQGLAFGSPVLRVDQGTTVTFRWTGSGGVHNVNVLELDRKSSLTYEQGTTYDVTFDEQAVYRYVCDPHRAIGMKGIVIVE